MVIESSVGFILRSKRRKEILILLNNGQLNQPEITNKTGMYKEHVSRALKELSDANLIKCVNPDDLSFKFYKITTNGVKVLEFIKKMS